jgi:hypothetical protein
MAGKFSKAAKKRKMKLVMGEYKRGTLKSSSGHKVTNRAQAIAIGMSYFKGKKK